MSLYFAEDLSPKTFRANMSHLVLKTSATRRSQGVDHLFSTTKTHELAASCRGFDKRYI